MIQAAPTATTGADSSIIDVLIAVDADTILTAYPSGTADAPTSIDKPLIFMIVRQPNAVFGNGSKELKLSASVLDEIRWRAVSLSLGADNDALLYKFFALRGDSLLSPPTPLLAHVQTPLPDPQDPLHPTTQAIENSFWTTQVLQQGSVTYAFQFTISNRAGTPLGYYAWDPFITITD